MNATYKPANEVWGVVTPPETKRAALFFDRVYRWPRIRGSFMSPLEDALTFKFWNKRELDWRPPDDIAFGSPEEDSCFDPVWMHLESKLLRHLSFRAPDLEMVLDGDVFAAAVADILQRNSAEKSPLFSATSAEYEDDYSSKLAGHFEVVLNHLPIVKAEGLDWDQVVEFRRDADNVRKYRELRLWLHSLFAAVSVGEAVDCIGAKLDAYKSAVEQWGFETTIGTLRQLCELPNVAAVGTGSTIGALLGGPVGAAIGAGLAVGGHTVKFVGERLLEYRNAQFKHREIAILYDIERKFGG